MEKSETVSSAGDRNLGPILIGVNWAVFGPSTIIVCLRLITRIWITHNIGWDDVTILLAQVVNAVGMGFVMLEVSYGLGRHIRYLPSDHIIGFLKYNFLDWVQVFLTLALSKISICLFLLRISKFEKYRYALFTIIAFLIITHTPLTLLFLLQCQPLNKNWDTNVPGQCFSKRVVEKIIIVQGIFSILTDFIGVAFPVILLWNARLGIRTKIALNVLMGLGIVTGTVCIVRTSYSWEVLSNDVTWVGSGNALTRILEVNFGIIGACAPIMRPLYLHLRSRFAPARHSIITSTATPMQWFTPPQTTPWYKRIFHAPVPIDKMDGRPSSTVNHVSQQSLHHTPQVPQPVSNKRVTPSWPLRQMSKFSEKRWHERSENVTWAKKEDFEPKSSDSFELPLQGHRKSEGSGSGGDSSSDDIDAFKTYRYHNRWV